MHVGPASPFHLGPAHRRIAAMLALALLIALGGAGTARLDLPYPAERGWLDG
jgi:hypothetical protein